MKKKIFLVFLSYTMVIQSCSRWFDVGTDDAMIDENTLFTNDNAFLNALADIYTQLREPELYGMNLSFLPEFAAQNFVPDNELQRQMAGHNYSGPEAARAIRDIWTHMYRAIASCNKVLEHIESTDVVFYYSDNKDLITGELYALRGALHFELLRMFHPIPTDGSFAGMPYMTRFGHVVGKALTTPEVLTLATNDLKRAEKLLDDKDPLFSNSRTYDMKPGMIERKLRTFHMNYYAVTALLARINLYAGDHGEAFRYADITFNHIRDITAAAQIFHYFGPGMYGSDLSFSREHIFGIASGPDGFTALSDKMFGQRQIAARADYLLRFPLTADTRHRDWFVHEGGTHVMSPKFSPESLLSGYTSTTGNERQLPVRIPFIKLGEVALIAAEALNETGSTDDAARWVTELQGMRDITTVKNLADASALTKELLRDEIRAEYHREFYGEGQLFFFHKRMNDTVLVGYDGSPLTTASSAYTFPIPADGLSADIR